MFWFRITVMSHAHLSLSRHFTGVQQTGQRFYTRKATENYRDLPGVSVQQSKKKGK
jgi:hypothetical protein